MDRERFYEKLLHSLLRADFRFKAEDLAPLDAESDKGKILYVRKAMELLPKLLAAIPNSPVSENMFRIHSIFDQEKLQQHLDSVREFATLVCFRYILSQPIILAVVEADQLDHNSSVDLASKLDDVILQMRAMTAKVGGFKLGRHHVGATKLTVQGILLYVFFDHMAASRFIKNTQRQCRRWHVWKMTYLHPWVVDVNAKEVRSDALISFFQGMGLERQLQTGLFAEAS